MRLKEDEIKCKESLIIEHYFTYKCLKTFYHLNYSKMRIG